MESLSPGARFLRQKHTEATGNVLASTPCLIGYNGCCGLLPAASCDFFRRSRAPGSKRHRCLKQNSYRREHRVSVPSGAGERWGETKSSSPGFIHPWWRGGLSKNRLAVVARGEQKSYEATGNNPQHPLHSGGAKSTCEDVAGGLYMFLPRRATNYSRWSPRS